MIQIKTYAFVDGLVKETGVIIEGASHLIVVIRDGIPVCSTIIK